MKKSQIELLCKLLPGYKEKLFKREYQLDKRNDYKFQTPIDGFLLYRRPYSPKTRYVLTFLRNLIKVIIDYRDINKKINERLLRDLNVSKNKKLYSLDASQKREFLKKRYIQSFEGGNTPTLPEPCKRYKIFIPTFKKRKSNFSVMEFFQSFESKNTAI